MIYWRSLSLPCVRVMKVSFQIKLFISLVAFFSVLFALLGGYYYADVGKQLYQEMSTRAKIQAEEIALIPTLRHEVEQKNISGADKKNKEEFDSKLKQLGIPETVIEQGKEAVMSYAAQNNIKLPKPPEKGGQINFSA